MSDARGQDDCDDSEEEEGGGGGGGGGKACDEVIDISARVPAGYAEDDGGAGKMVVGGVRSMDMEESIEKGGESGGQSEEEARVERCARRRLELRVLPIICFASMIYFMLRYSVSFAAEGIMKTLDITSAEYGVAAGMYAIPFSLTLVPLSVVCKRMGARLAFSLMCFLGGATSVLTGIAVTNYASLIVLRLLLGTVQAPFVAFVIYYLASFFKDTNSRAVSLSFMLGFTLSQVLPVPAAIIAVASSIGPAETSWRSLYVVEGILSAALTLPTYFLLPNSVLDCKRFMRSDELQWMMQKAEAIQAERDDEKRKRSPVGKGGGAEDGALTSGQPDRWWKVLIDVRTLSYTATQLFSFVALNGVVYFQPIVLSRGGEFSMSVSAALNCIPFAMSYPIYSLYGWHSDRSGERIGHACLAHAFYVCSLLSCVFVMGQETPSIALALVSLTCVQIGFAAWYTPFGSFVAASLPPNRPDAFGVVSLGASLSGAIGPPLVGALNRSGDFGMSMLALTGFASIALCILGTLFIIEWRFHRHEANEEDPPLPEADDIAQGKGDSQSLCKI